MKTMQELIPNGAEIAMIMLVMIFFGDIHSLPIVSILCIFWTSMVHHTIDQIKIHMHVINIHYTLRTKKTTNKPHRSAEAVLTLERRYISPKGVPSQL